MKCYLNKQCLKCLVIFFSYSFCAPFLLFLFWRNLNDWLVKRLLSWLFLLFPPFPLSAKRGEWTFPKVSARETRSRHLFKVRFLRPIWKFDVSLSTVIKTQNNADILVNPDGRSRKMGGAKFSFPWKIAKKNPTTQYTLYHVTLLSPSFLLSLLRFVLHVQETEAYKTRTGSSIRSTTDGTAMNASDIPRIPAESEIVRLRIADCVVHVLIEDRPLIHSKERSFLGGKC